MGYAQNSNATVNNIDYDEVFLSNNGSEFEIEDVWMPKVQSWSSVYHHLTSPFSFDHYTSPRIPIDLGKFDIDFVQSAPRVLRLTVKPVGTNTVSLPEETENPMFDNRKDEYDSLPFVHLNETRFTRHSDKKIPYQMYGIEKV